MGLLQRLLPLIGKLGVKEIALAVEKLEREDVRTLLSKVEREKRAKVLTHLSPAALEKVVDALGPKEFARTLLYLEDHEAAGVLRQLPEDVRAEVFVRLPSKKQVTYSFLLKYSDDVAGGWMRTDFLAVRPEERVRDVLKRLESFSGWAGDVYVVNEEGILLGKVPLPFLLGAKRSAKILDVMEGAYHVEVTEPIEVVAQAFVRHRPSSVAVTYRGRLVGVIPAEEGIRVVEEVHGRQLARMFALGDVEHIKDPIKKSVKNRAPWLVINLFTEFVVAFFINFFEDTLKNFVVLAILMPIVASEGGNAATQTMAIIVRSMATGEATKKEFWRIFRKELALAFLDGLIVGIVAGIMAIVWKGNIMAALAMALAVPLNLVVAAFAGVVIPYILKAVGIDPASASTVILTTLTDICGFAGFLAIATALTHILPPAYL